MANDNKQRFLRVSGTILADNRLILRPSYLTASPRGSFNDRESPVQIELLVGDRLRVRWGATVQRVHTTGRAPRGSNAEPRSLRAKVPFLADTDRIVFRDGDVVLHEIRVPEHGPSFSAAPEVKRTKGGVRIRWNSWHPDGLELHHHVRASADGGRTWVRLGSRLTKNELTVPGDALVGPTCVVEVVAYDGVNTASERINYPDAPAPAMQVFILSPGPGEVCVGSPVTLRAHARILGRGDRIDPVAEFVWTADGREIARGHYANWQAPESDVELAVACRFEEFAASAVRKLRVVESVGDRS